MIPTHRHEVHLAEYRQLKDEQRDRIRTRDGLLYAVFTACAAANVVALGGGSSRSAVLLLLPLVCAVLGWTYLRNDQKITQIRIYLRTRLASQLTGDESSTAWRESGGTVLGWESWHQDDTHRRRDKLIQAAVDVTAFCVTGMSAVITCLSMAPSLLFGVIGALEMAALTLLGWELVRRAEISPVPVS